MRIEDYVHAQTRIVCAGNKQFLCSLPAEKRVCFSPAGGSDQEACRPADGIRAPNCCQSARGIFILGNYLEIGNALPYLFQGPVIVIKSVMENQ